MKKRLICIALTLVMALSLLSPAALAEGEDAGASITHALSEDGTTLTFSGSGAITPDILTEVWTQYKTSTITNVVIGEGITEIAGYKGTSAFLSTSPGGEKKEISIRIDGGGSFRFADNSCSGLIVSVTADERTSIEIGSQAFSSATLTQFPINKITKIGQSGLSRATLPVEGTTLSLHLTGASDLGALASEYSLGTNALSYSKNQSGSSITAVDITISGAVGLGAPTASGSNIFGNNITTAAIHLEDGAVLVLNSGFGGSCSLETLTFTGSGTVYFDAKPLSRTITLETIDFSDFTGDIQFAEDMFGVGTSRPTSQYSKPKLNEVRLGENCRVTGIGENAFNYCEQLKTFDLSKVQGPIGARAFQGTALTGPIDLSGATAIGQRAFEGVEADWTNAAFPKDLGRLQLECSNPFLTNEAVWSHVKAALDCSFQLNQSSYGPLAPSDKGWTDSKAGESNATTPGSTQLTKAAKWTDGEQTAAEVEIQAAYAPNQQMDFVFVLDTSDSMRSVSSEEAGLGKVYEMISKTADVANTLLTSNAVDSRVAVVAFGSSINANSTNYFPSGAGFFDTSHAAEAEAMIRGLKCAGDTNYAVGLEEAFDFVGKAQYAGRAVTVVFLSDGYPNKKQGDIQAAAKKITDCGVEIIGVLYNGNPGDQELTYIGQACSTYYQAEDTEGFSEAVNRTIYDAFHTFTLTDRIGGEFQPATKDDIAVTAGTFRLSDDGRTITWDLSGTKPYTAYTMTIQLKLAAGEDGSYPEGTFPTNSGPATLQPNGGDDPVNQVPSPQLSRNNGGDVPDQVTLRYVSNGGTAYSDEQYERNTVVQLDKIPVRPGYDFTGWYADEALTQRITSVTMDTDKTVYAGWRENGGQLPPDPPIPPVNPDIPVTPPQPDKPALNTEDHVAYIIGYPDGTVQPQGNITRAEVTTIFFRLLTDESRASFWSKENGYSDVRAASWYNNAVSTMTNAGIVAGYPDGSFRPNAPITRAEFATIAARFSEVVYNGGNSFTDVPENHWAARYIALAEYLGWINGYPDGSFKPDQAITRAEAMTLINRVLERAVEEEHMLPDMVKWPDNLPAAWYYEAVQEATNSHEYTRLAKRVPDQDFCYEDWLLIEAVPDWEALEKTWSTAYSK